MDFTIDFHINLFIDFFVIFSNIYKYFIDLSFCFHEFFVYF